jgi:hypothetical protein
MYKNSLIAGAIVLLAAASVAVGDPDIDVNDIPEDKRDVQDWSEADRDLSFSDFMKKVKEIKERDRAASAAEEATLPKLRDESLYDHTGPFPVKV